MGKYRYFKYADGADVSGGYVFELLDNDDGKPELVCRQIGSYSGISVVLSIDELLLLSSVANSLAVNMIQRSTITPRVKA